MIPTQIPETSGQDVTPEARAVIATKVPRLRADLLVDADFARANRALGAFLEAVRDAPKPGDALALVADEVAGKYLAGKVPDVTRQLAAVAEAKAVEAGWGDIVKLVPRRLHDARNAAAVAVAHRLRVDYNQRVQDILAGLRSRGIRPEDASPAEVLESGRHDEHRALLEAAREYESIMATWPDIYRGTGGQIPTGSRSWHSWSVQIGNPDAHTEHLGAAINGHILQHTGTDEVVRPELPWPAPSDTVALLAWAASTPAAQLWFPSREQYDAADEVIARLSQEAVAASRQGLEITYVNHRSFVDNGVPWPVRVRVDRAVPTQPDADGWRVIWPESAFVA